MIQNNSENNSQNDDFMDFSELSELNPQQKEAVQTVTGPLLILAGAGSGKTRVLTHRLANLIYQGEASPEQILAVTFTNKAAREMAHRVEDLLTRMGIPVYEPLWVSTFHSFCSRVLREEIHNLGYQPYFIIYDDSDQLSMIKKILQELDLNDKTYPPKNIKSRINQAKMLGLKPDEVSKKSFFLMDEVSLQVYEHYENGMKRANALDFDDLLLKTLELFTNHPEILNAYQDRFRHIMVDEYQDTNHVQYKLIKLLSSKHRNLCVVGDEDQSIYSWRGADIQNILSFEKDFPEVKVIKLEENYRSSKVIVEASSHLIQNNTQRKNKTLYTQNASGSKIKVISEPNEYEEARYVAKQTQDLLARGGYTLNDFAVFYRTNAQSRVLEEQMRSYSIPYRVVGAVRFYDRMEIKDIVSYLRLVLNPTDDMAFLRVINVPTRGIGKTSVEAIKTYAAEYKISLLDAAQAVAESRLVHAGACNKLQTFRFLIEKLQKFSSENSVSELYLKTLDETGYAQKLKVENTPEAQSRIENLEELHNAILQFEKESGEEATLQGFLEQMALISDADRQKEDAEALTLMTLHLSKGLEYKNVFIVGMEEGLFPSQRSIHGDDPQGVEEERRLAYVGMTRAMENLHLCSARMRRVWGQEEYRPPSRFIEEVPDQYKDMSEVGEKSQFFNRFVKKYGGTSSKNLRPEDLSQDMPSYEDFGDESFQGQSPGENSKGLQKSVRVRHPVFGVGSIFQVEGAGDSQKVSVLFQDKSLRKFITKHARLERV